MYRKTAYDYITDHDIFYAIKPYYWKENWNFWKPIHKKDRRFHAYHIKWLVSEIIKNGCKWVGNPPYKWRNGYWDGHHRTRAAKFLLNNFGIKIKIPPFHYE